MRTLWADIEGTYDSEWSHAIGTDPEKYFLALADYGEMYVDVADSALKADDCGLVVGDSLAALMPIREFEAASEDQYLGAQARMIGKCVRKLKQRMIRERKRGHPCTIIFTNQMRKKIGEMFGNPETMAGGHGMMHEFSLLIRTVQKGLTETDKKKFSGEKGKKDFATRHSFLIKKMKVLTLASSGEFVRLTDSVKEADMEKGEIDDYATVMNYAKTYGVVEKDGDSWRLLGKKAKRQSDIIQYWKKFPDEYYKASRAIIQKAKEQLADA
jgi:RecA/RadA recombinase